MRTHDPPVRLLLLPLALSVTIFAAAVCGKPTIYKKNNNDKLEPVLVPVSSTVIPISVYKVGYGIGVSGGSKLSKPHGPTKLITVNKKATSASAYSTDVAAEERPKN